MKRRLLETSALVASGFIIQRGQNSDALQILVGGYAYHFPVEFHMIIHNGDHAEFEQEHASTPPKERPDWPLPSFDARDWAEAFVKMVIANPAIATDEATMTTWFSGALMRGFDEHASRLSAPAAAEIEGLVLEAREVAARLERYGVKEGEAGHDYKAQEHCVEARSVLKMAAALTAKAQQYSALSCKITDVQRASDAAHRDCQTFTKRAEAAERILEQVSKILDVGEADTLTVAASDRMDALANAERQLEAMREVVKKAKTLASEVNEIAVALRTTNSARAHQLLALVGRFACSLPSYALSSSPAQQTGRVG